MSSRSFIARGAALVVFAAVVASTGCASTGATFRSGVGDAHLERAPWYAGASHSVIRSNASRVAYLPVEFQSGATQPAVFDPSTTANSPTQSLLAEMNAYLDSLARASGVAIRLDADPRAGDAPARVAPDVQFGCLTESGLQDDACAIRADSVVGRGSARMRLAVGRPSPAWTAWVAEGLAAQHAGRALVIRLEVGSYLVRQRGLRGRKEVDLGTGHTTSLPWLTSLETPVPVLQLTGALVDANGQAVRIGAEGIYAKRTRLLVSAVGGVEVLGDEAVTAARAERRSDLPGAPLAWQVAMRELVAQLTGRVEVAR